MNNIFNNSTSLNKQIAKAKLEDLKKQYQMNIELLEQEIDITQKPVYYIEKFLSIISKINFGKYNNTRSNKGTLKSHIQNKINIIKKELINEVEEISQSISEKNKKKMKYEKNLEEVQQLLLEVNQYSDSCIHSKRNGFSEKLNRLHSEFYIPYNGNKTYKKDLRK